ncbi:DNA mismatch endonuclease Vsr [Sphingomonas kaistensis]|uniref:Very short patch repair endonuclease n=1 Tax=Sphingomonas kaistensis TaxID=298708 RepID=A0ABZ2FX92_9SPHN
MSDVVDRTTRSRMMANIRGKNTKPEVELRSALHRRGLRFRIHDKRLPGRPDIVFPKYKAVVHVHGCYWHRHRGCRFATTPSSNIEFWQAKFNSNVDRDWKTDRALKEAGWRTFVVWECSMREAGATAIAAKVHEWLLSH